MRKAAIRAIMSRAVDPAAVVDKGTDLVVQVSSSAAGFMRNRKDVSVIAERKRRAARRRVTGWSGVSVVALGAAAVPVTGMVTGGVTGGAVFLAVVCLALLIWGLVNLTRAVSDLRDRTRFVRELPPPQPARPVVASAIRPQIQLLDGYSDGLRQLVGMIGVVHDDPQLRAMRDDILGSADTAEARLRRQAADYSGLVKARNSAPPEARPRLDGTAEHLRAAIEVGVAGYGELVTAASETVAASRELAAGSAYPETPELRDRTDQLRALASGMRELGTG